MAFTKLSGALLAYAPRQPLAASGARAKREAGPPPEEQAALLASHLRALKLPAFLAEHETLARQCAAEGLDHRQYLLRLAERELAARDRRRVERLIRQARFPTVKSLDNFDFAAAPVDRNLLLELAQCAFVANRENLILVGDSGTGKTHIALGLGLAACRKGLTVGFTTAAALVQDLFEARAGHHLRRLQARLAACRLLIIDELGYAPLPQGAAELLFEIVSARSESGSTIFTSNLPVYEWAQIFGDERLTTALLERLAYRGQLIELAGGSYRLRHAGAGPALHLAVG